jgi:predicted O-methyltransferase YrrM
MDAALRGLLDELARFGQENDAVEVERGRRMLNITPETGQFLAILIRSIRATEILEIGTSNGYSTIWLADAARDTGGLVMTIEQDTSKIALAKANIARANLAGHVWIVQGNARDLLENCGEWTRRTLRPLDFIFLDADRPSYLTYLDLLLPLLRPGGLLVTDNVVSHAHELTDFLARLKSDPALDSVTVPIGNGEEVTLKR